jgi:predicted secreted hydrolase
VAQAAPRGSRWASRDVWFAHLAVGDVARERFTAVERFARGAQGLAGARARPFAVWIGDWRAASDGGTEVFPMRLAAAGQGVAIDLVVDPIKPIVLQGDRGLSRKGPEPGNASYYYSITRMAASGTVTVGDTAHAVNGLSWLDREWSTSALSEGQVGWDWFAIQLTDGRDLMLYRMRREDGTTDPHNGGTLVEEDGTARRLGPADVRYEPGRTWVSPVTGASYPVEWRVSVVPLELELQVDALLDASELDVAVRYWEGAIRVRGRGPSGEVSGRGFLEMTGYDGAEARQVPSR